MIAIGIDAGGTSTAGVLSIDGKIVNTVIGGPANFATDCENACTVVLNTIERLLLENGSRPDACVVGAAGVFGIENFSAPFKIEIHPDTHIALRAAVPEGDGIVLIAGTGSIASAELSGEYFRAGGHGYMFGDDGSGFALGRSAVQLFSKTLDGRAKAGTFTGAIGQAIGATSREALNDHISQREIVRKTAALAPIVLQAAHSGDRSATRIVQAATLALANLLKELPIPDREVPLVFAGGLLQENSLLTYLLETYIANEFPFCRIMKNPLPPHIGALRIAERGYAR